MRLPLQCYTIVRSGIIICYIGVSITYKNISVDILHKNELYTVLYNKIQAFSTGIVYKSQNFFDNSCNHYAIKSVIYLSLQECKFLIPGSQIAGRNFA